MLTRMGKQEEQESIIVLRCYNKYRMRLFTTDELIYEQLKIAKEDITKTDRLLAIPLTRAPKQRKKGGTGLGAFNRKGYPKSIQGKHISG